MLLALSSISKVESIFNKNKQNKLQIDASSSVKICNEVCKVASQITITLQDASPAIALQHRVRALGREITSSQNQDARVRTTQLYPLLSR